MSVAQKLIITLHIILLLNKCCGRGSCYGVKLNGDVVEQSRSKEVHCSEHRTEECLVNVTPRFVLLVCGVYSSAYAVRTLHEQ